MEIFFSYYLISLGLGQLAAKLFSREGDYLAHGLNTFLGFSLIPLLLFVLNLVFRIPLNISAYIIILLSICGLIRSISNVKESGYSYFNHPIFLLVIPIIIVFAVASNGYYPFSWDEFSHWATMPKQIFLHKEITSDGFLIKNFAAYTPGWPLIVIFKDLIFSKLLHYDHFLLLPLFSSLLMLSSLFDAVKLTLKKSETFGWIIIFIALLLSLPTAHFYQTNLIEFPMIHSLCFVFILCFIQFNSSMNIKENFIRIGIALAYCYLLKHTFMTMIPIILLFYLYYLMNASNRFSRKNFILLLYLIAPYFVVFIIWQWNLGMHDLVQGYSPVNTTLTSAIEKVMNRLVIFPLSLKSFLLLFVSGNAPQITFMLLSPFALIVKKIRPVGILLITYLFFYFACLLWMYFTVFSFEDATTLVSFERFMSVPLAPITLFSFLATAIWLFEKISGRWNFSFPANKTRLLSICFLGICVVFLSGIFYRKIRRTPKAKNEIAIEARSLINLIQENNLKLPKVIVIAQGGNRFEYHVANLESIGGNSYFYSAMFGTSWGEINDNQWRILTTKPKMLQLISGADILWVYKSDKWMDETLGSLKFTKSCTSTYEKYFILNNRNGTYTCHEKKL